MGRSGHHGSTLAAAAVAVILVAGCSEDGSSGGSASGGGDGHDGHGIDIDVGDRCDLGFNTADFNETTALVHGSHGEDHVAEHEPGSGVDFTIEEWAEVFVDEDLGLSVDEVVERIEADDIDSRHVLFGVLTHTLDPDPWTPMTDRAECDALAGELGKARAAAARYPTVADALAAGYRQGDDYNAGLGAHYQNWDLLGPFDPGRPVQLLYDGTGPGAALVGLSYVVNLPGEEPPEGFSGPNDRWHRHRSVCLDVANGGINLSADVLSVDECAARGGTYVPNTQTWMLHTWVAPGCESDWGLFSGANPRIPYLPEGERLSSGCNSGRTLADPLELDERGDGPDIRESPADDSV